MEIVRIRLNSLIMTTEAWPTQWEAYTTKGDKVDIRFRHGSLTVCLNGKHFDPIFYYTRSIYISWMKQRSFIGDGIMKTKEMIKIVSKKSNIIKFK